MGSNREKSNIARVTKIISHFDSSNNFFVDCILTPFSNKQIEVRVYLEEYFIQFDEVLRIRNDLILFGLKAVPNSIDIKFCITIFRFVIKTSSR